MRCPRAQAPKVQPLQELAHDAAPVAELFDHVLESWRIGSRKPEAGAYEIAQETLGVEAVDCVFVDDQPVNVAAAEALGMNGILVTDPADGARSLEAALGIEP